MAVDVVRPLDDLRELFGILEELQGLQSFLDGPCPVVDQGLGAIGKLDELETRSHVTLAAADGSGEALDRVAEAGVPDQLSAFLTRGRVGAG